VNLQRREEVCRLQRGAGEFVAVSVCSGSRRNDGNAVGGLGSSGGGAALQGAAALGEARGGGGSRRGAQGSSSTLYRGGGGRAWHERHTRRGAAAAWPGRPWLPGLDGLWRA
jgi:hypothetical protein